MAQLKVGSRLRSAVCSTEVMVIAVPQANVEIRCGGEPMIDVAQERPPGGSASPAAAKGTAMGKRYVSEAGDLELLCTKPGEGSLGIGESLLQPKDAKPLPSSD
jgi:hypothetical protein